MEKHFLSLLAVFAAYSAAGQAVPDSYPYPRPFPTNGQTPLTHYRFPAVLSKTDYSDPRPVIWDVMTGGGFRSVGTEAERDSIIEDQRKEGMFVFVTATTNLWRLDSDKTTWVEFTGGGGGETTIYSGNGSLSSARTVTIPTSLTFSGAGLLAASTTNVNLLGADLLSIASPGELRVVTPSVAAGVSATGRVLTLKDATTGRAEYDPAPASYYHGDAFDYTVSTNNAYRIRSTSAHSLNIITPDYTTTNTYPNGTTVFVRFGMYPNVLTNTTLIGIKRASTLALGDSGPAAPIYTTDGFVPEDGVLRLQRTYQLIYREYQTPAGWYVADSVSDPARDFDVYIRRFDGSMANIVAQQYLFGDWTSINNWTPQPAPTVVNFPGRPAAMDFEIINSLQVVNGVVTKNAGMGSGLVENHLKLGEGRTVFSTTIMTPATLATDSNSNYEIRCGFSETSFGTSTRGVFFRYNNSSTNWHAVTVLASVPNSSQDTGVAVAVSTVYKLRIEIPNGAQTAYFFINDVLVKTETASLFSGYSNLVNGQSLIWRRSAGAGPSVTLRIANALVYIRPDGR